MAVDHYRRIEEVLRERLQPAALAGLFRVKRAKLSRGIDRIDADLFERRLSIELGVASRRALSGNFRFSPYLEMLVSKGRKKAPRVIAKPTIRDKLILSALKDALHAELPLDVPRKLPNQVVRELLNVLEASAGAQIVKLDIQAFYDRIPHKKLLGRMRKRLGDGLALSLIEAAITGAIVPDSYRKSEYKDYVLTRGVPQGLPISNFLAHIYLSDFDKSVGALFSSYFRYVDDIVVVSPVVSESTVEKALTKKLNGIGLGINKEKTKKFCYED
ncbi:hypothetical protein XTPLMG728_3293 [Xanthomonas translucens pv. poae]|uniref:Reverse transcriptase domain-containing protein n=1 Tax=Xanthomonas graminis pv. poae TaxID=227946 RepID=A0A0K3A446_9XANT|nr:reverse transcriptase domain-containing protein [Xanthomonas translucens]UKE62331.1 hypothetical protein KM539_01880 [Xanthomonas translucens pv. poae]CTP92593.1 hypothetical protein XTPLMG728_3293 [Xanthomonas translucens pv. poae]